jgi:hypothetical protein
MADSIAVTDEDIARYRDSFEILSWDVLAERWR